MLEEGLVNHPAVGFGESGRKATELRNLLAKIEDSEVCTLMLPINWCNICCFVFCPLKMGLRSYMFLFLVSHSLIITSKSADAVFCPKEPSQWNC